MTSTSMLALNRWYHLDDVMLMAIMVSMLMKTLSVSKARACWPIMALMPVVEPQYPAYYYADHPASDREAKSEQEGDRCSQG